MPKWSSEKTPSKYRNLEKRLEALNQTLNSLPKPQIDFFALSYRQRDLIEIYLHCAMRVLKSDEYRNYDQNSEDTKLEVFNNQLIQKLKENVDENDVLELAKILNNPPQLIQKNDQLFHNPIYPPNLMDFLAEQQGLYGWIPQPGRLLPLQLTWVAWDELMSLMAKHGYNFDLDDVSRVRTLKEWPMTDKRKIVHLYLEMISSEETRNKFLAVQNYDEKILPIRKRLTLRDNERRYGVVNKKVVLLKDE